MCVGGRPLAEPASATIPGKPLTATLTGPAEHDGSESFTVRLTFSMEPDVSYKTVRDTMSTEKGGAISGAKRVKPPHDLEFDITVEPDGDGAVSLSLASPLPACGEAGAVCTAAGRKIEGTVSATIPGPVDLGGGRDGARGTRGGARLRGNPGPSAGRGGDGRLCHRGGDRRRRRRTRPSPQLRSERSWLRTPEALHAACPASAAVRTRLPLQIYTILCDNYLFFRRLSREFSMNSS